jgi:hypothetical protein
MNDQNDFTALRNLLAQSKNDYPQDTQVEEFLTEFHRRQRAQLLVRKSLFELVPSLSYASVAAAIAITAVVGLSQQVAVTTNSDGQTKFSLRLPGTHESSLAMLPGTLLSSTNVSSPKLTEAENFTPSRSDAPATRYVLANTTHGANDSTVAF